MVDASPAGTLNVVTSKDSLKIFIIPNIAIISLIISVAGNQIYSSFIRLKPLQLYQKAISLAGCENHDIKVIIGKNLLIYNTDNEIFKTNRPTVLT